MMEKGLNNNQLKLIAMITMTVDHVGMLFFPQSALLRIIGRLAFPVYAYMIAEGCSYTRSMGKYLGSVGAMALLCQVVAWFVTGSLRQSILVTFTLSIFLCWLAKLAVCRKKAWTWAAFAAGLMAALFITEVLPELLPGTDISVDYGFLGVILPVGVYLAKNRKGKLLFTALDLCLLALNSWEGQWFALLALPLLGLYNGRRGKLPMKWLFYFYYPAHLAVLWGIFALIQ